MEYGIFCFLLSPAEGIDVSCELRIRNPFQLQLWILQNITILKQDQSLIRPPVWFYFDPKGKKWIMDQGFFTGRLMNEACFFFVFFLSRIILTVSVEIMLVQKRTTNSHKWYICINKLLSPHAHQLLFCYYFFYFSIHMMTTAYKSISTVYCCWTAGNINIHQACLESILSTLGLLLSL